jgi:hypothetical protein
MQYLQKNEISARKKGKKLKKMFLCSGTGPSLVWKMLSQGSAIPGFMLIEYVPNFWNMKVLGSKMCSSEVPYYNCTWYWNEPFLVSVI